jgi:DNA-binding winged helix-turn-helix (wHTH) protein/pimeloyl-ACP methyl ester carboxylesterase/class 3 adenylate cyclase
MDASQRPSPVIEATLAFGECELDRASGRLRRRGQIVPITPKAYDVLAYLVEHAGRLVTKPELFDALWPDVFVGDAALKVCIREIRKALDDDAQVPRYIETAHRRGYRFIAPVTSDIVERSRPSEVHRPSDGPVASRLPFDVPETHYARSGDVNIAYQVIGDGPIDLVFVMGWVSHLDCFWTEPGFARFLRRLAEFSRVVLFDKRGTGLSDRVGALPTLEQRMDDVRAVMAAAGSREAVLLGVSEGGPMCSLFATTYPEKTRALVMIGTYAKRIRADDYPWAPTRDAREAFFEEIRTKWGGPVGIETRAPSRATDPAFRAWWSHYLRQGASPGAALTLTQMNAEIDVRDVLPLVRVPTLVLHRTGDRCLLVDEGRYVASLVPGAQFVELPGDDHLPFVGDQDAIVDEVSRFVTAAARREPHDRVLATVLCATLDGPRGAADNRSLAAHVRREVAWLRGRGLTFTSDGFFAAFDGPARAIACARALAVATGRFKACGRFGLHTGECDVLAGGRAAGVAVERARAVCELAAHGEVLVSRTVTDLVAGSGVAFGDRGVHSLTPGGEAWRLFAVTERPETARAVVTTDRSPRPRRSAGRVAVGRRRPVAVAALSSQRRAAVEAR